MNSLNETRIEKLDFLGSESSVVRRRDEEDDVLPLPAEEERKVPNWRQ